MIEDDLPREGGCRCGGLQFRVSARPLLTMACHCTGCQRMTGSAFSLSAAFPIEGFRVTRGQPVLGGLRGASRHHFCPSCMSWVFTHPEGADGIVNVRSTMLDAPRALAPFIETYTSEKLPWASVGATRSFPRFPAIEDFEGLLADYAAVAPRGAA